MSKASLLWKITHLRSTIGTCLRYDEKVRSGFLFEESNSHIFMDPISSANLNRMATKKDKHEIQK